MLLVDLGMLAMLGDGEEEGEFLSCLLWVVAGLVLKDFFEALEGLFLNSLVTRRGVLLGCDSDLLGMFRDKVMLGEVGSEEAGSVFGSDLDCIVKGEEGVGREVKGLSCCFSLS